MRTRYLLALTVILGAMCFAWGAVTTTPYGGQLGGGGFLLVVIDTDIDETAFELLNGETGYTPMLADTTIRMAYSYQTYYDTLVAGQGSNLAAVWSLSSTADATQRDNFLYKAGTPGTVTGIFGNAYSSAGNSYLYRYNDTDFRLGTANFTLSAWTKSATATNPSAVQTIFSAATSPDELKIAYATTGKVTVTLTDDNDATTDALTSTADLYDNTWHQLVVTRNSTSLKLYVDGVLDGTETIDAAAGAVDPDSVWLGSLRGATLFTGKLDEAWYATKDLGADFVSYGYKRVASKLDSAYVRLTGLDRSGNYRQERALVQLATPGTTDSVYSAFEWAWVDTVENEPLIVFSTGASPRSAALDSIPEGQRHYPNAQVFFGSADTPILQKVAFFNYGATAATYELRLYPDAADTVNYAANYTVVCAGYIPSGGEPLECDYTTRDGDGIMLAPGSYLAGMGKGAAADAQGGVIIQGLRRSRR